MIRLIYTIFIICALFNFQIPYAAAAKPTAKPTTKPTAKPTAKPIQKPTPGKLSYSAAHFVHLNNP